MSKCCVICVGRNADRAADRIEAYAKKADFEIVETIFKDTKSVERLKFYIERIFQRKYLPVSRKRWKKVFRLEMWLMAIR